MDQLLEMVRQVPPFTRYWSICILGCSIVTSLKLTSHMNLLFKPDKAFNNEPWRLLTSFCYISDFSLQLVFNVWMLSQSCRNLEDTFISHQSLFPPLNGRQQRLLQASINHYKFADFLYYMFQICCSILIMVSIGYYYLNYRVSQLAPILQEVILYLWCRTSPHLDINIFGLLNIRRAYVPWVTILVNLLFNRIFLSEIVSIVLGDYSRIMVLLKDEYFWKNFIIIGLGHTWWFVREFLMNDLYFNKNNQSRLLRQQTLQRYGISNDNWIKRGLIVLLRPPWYYQVLNMLKNIPDDPPEHNVDGDNRDEANHEENHEENPEEDNHEELNFNDNDSIEQID
jgi:Derlin-2/3